MIAGYEHRSQPLASRARFMQRLLSHGAAALAAILISLAIGTTGYHWIAQQSWIDSFLNASMILTGMGPVDRMESDGAKLFAALYALFSGLVFAAAASVVIAPFLRRVLHRFHAPDEATGP